MKSGRAALYANCILWKEASDDLLAFFQWRDFERDFASKFCQKDEATAALTKLESTRYYQGRTSVDDYIDEFFELVDEARYTDGLAIVMKFQKGLDWDIQDRIAEMVQGRPNDADPQGWYNAAQLLDANKSANQAFHGSERTAPPVHISTYTKHGSSSHQLRARGKFPAFGIPGSPCTRIQHSSPHGGGFHPSTKPHSYALPTMWILQRNVQGVMMSGI